MALYNGWTPELPEDEKRRNELAALRELVTENPDNEYWWDRLVALEAEIEAEFIARWFEESHITVCSNPALLGGVRYDPRTPEEKEADFFDYSFDFDSVKEIPF